MQECSAPCKVSSVQCMSSSLMSIETGLHLAHLQSHWNWESDQQKIILILMTVPMMSSTDAGAGEPLQVPGPPKILHELLHA